MNKKKLLQIGVPGDCVGAAIQCIQVAAGDPEQTLKAKKVIPQIVAAPNAFLNDAVWGSLAQSIIDNQNRPGIGEPIPYLSWGKGLEQIAIQQMENACRLPISRAAALMPDAHPGYGLPIGGVLACENAIIPYGVGVDIACRMKLTVTDLPVPLIEQNDMAACRELDRALKNGTVFGTGRAQKNRQHHPVMDEDWTITAATREMENVQPGRYVALLSHSGSRGAGARVCQRYTDIARQAAPSFIRDDPHLRHLAWLEMDSEAGQEYWLAMNLMGLYASANHEIIHRNVLRLAGAESLYSIENHHNFAWEEEHGGQKYYVHRKGATPAGKGTLGIIPGNMADSCFVVRGKGHPGSLNSAAHGAGRVMSRTAAIKQFRWGPWREHLERRNVRLLAAGLDEVPGVYKNIHEVMEHQKDLVEIVGEFQPRIVMMCGDGSRAED